MVLTSSALKRHEYGTARQSVKYSEFVTTPSVITTKQMQRIVIQ